jgi:hypothetical protein
MPKNGTTPAAEHDETTKTLIAFLRGQPKRFTLKRYYCEVPELFELLIKQGWIESPVHLKSGPSRCVIECDLRDGWRVNVDAPCEFNGDRDRKLTTIRFLGPGDPSPPHTINVEGFSQSPAFPSRRVWARPKRAA